MRSGLRGSHVAFASALFFIAAMAHASAQEQPAPTPSPTATPTAAPAVPAPLAPSPAATPWEKAINTDGNLYDVDNEIYSTVPDATAYYYFQGNRDGSAKVKQELRLGTTLWNDNAQFRIRLPYITRFPVAGNPYYSIGNIELGYNYSVASKTFDHSLEFRVALPTAQQGVESTDTQLKAFYTTKWKFPGWALSYANEYDQTVIQPPGSTYTSYYEGKLTLPDYQFAKGVKVSAFWNYRILTDSGGKFKDALGGTIFGGMNDVALSVTDSWGLGNNALWKYKFEANLTAKF